MTDINQFHARNGRTLKENSDYINIADYLEVTDGLAYATLRGKASIVFNFDRTHKAR